VLLIFVGAALTAWGDFNSSLQGMVLCMLSVIFFSVQMLETNRIGNTHNDEVHPLEMS